MTRWERANLAVLSFLLAAVSFIVLVHGPEALLHWQRVTLGLTVGLASFDGLLWLESAFKETSE
jgi:hypothetical protein